MKPMMTSEKILALVEQYRKALIPEWQVDVEFPGHDDPDGSNEACVRRTDDYHRATMVIYKGWECFDDSKVECVIVHELIHVLFRDVDVTLDFLEGSVHRDVMFIFRSAFKHASEGAVERLARFIVNRG